MSGRLGAVTVPAHLTDRHTAVTSAVGVLIATVGYLITALELGAAAGLVLILLWLALPPVYVVAGGYLLLSIVGINVLLDPAMIIVVFGLSVVLISPAWELPRGRWIVMAAILGGIGLGAITVGSYLAFDGTLPAAFILVAAMWLVAYGLFRYRIVALGADGDPV